MILLRDLDGATAGRETLARRFPFRVGRSSEDHLRLDQAGVWEGHFRIERSADHVLTVHTREGVPTLVNGSAVSSSPLRNGDIIQAGAARLQFWLSPVRQPELRLREALTWIGLAALVAFEVVVAFSLTR